MPTRTVLFGFLAKGSTAIAEDGPSSADRRGGGGCGAGAGGGDERMKIEIESNASIDSTFGNGEAVGRRSRRLLINTTDFIQGLVRTSTDVYKR